MANAQDAQGRLILSGCRIKSGDILIIAFVLLFGVGSVFAIRDRKNRINTCRIYSSGKLVVSTALDCDTIIYVQGPLGVTTVELRGGSVRVLSSPCRDKLCVKMGKQHRAGSVIACVPNRVLVVIVGHNDIESITY
jgi:hypothetical protein